MPSWYVVCLIVAAVIFAIDAWKDRNLQSVGLFFLTLAQLLYGR